MRTPTPRERFARDGYLPPVRVLDDGQARAAAGHVYAALGVDPAAPGPSSAYPSAWHHHWRWAYDLATSSSILDLVEPLIGPDIVLWAMACWYKEPFSGKRVPWHQDASYWPMEPNTTVSAWLALNETTRANGCLRILPGSHRDRLEHAPITDPTSWFGTGITEVDESTAVDMTMRPGEAAIFSEATLHGSEANTSALPRLGVSFRYSPPSVRFLMDRWTDPHRIRTFLVRGEDRLHLNDAIRGEAPMVTAGED